MHSSNFVVSLVFALLFLTAFAYFSCGDDDDDDDDVDTQFEIDDDSGSGGNGDDDTSSGGDDDDDFSAPLLYSAAWDPETITRGESSNLNIEVCQIGNGLVGGGIYLWWAGTGEPFTDDELTWDDVEGGAPNAPDCALPVTVALEIDLSAFEVGNFCVDLEATDAEGHLSNKLEDLCVNVVEPPL